jgi:hypothetical protein
MKGYKSSRRRFGTNGSKQRSNLILFFAPLSLSYMNPPKPIN